jgi:hypothetical protein
MGKGNWIPVGHDVADYGGYYVDYDYDDPFFYEDLVSIIKEELMDRFVSLEETEDWAYGGKVILKNAIVRVVVADNEYSLAVYVVVPDTERYRYPELGKKNLPKYLEGLKEVLLSNYPGKVRYRTGPWTSGVLRAAV